MRILIPCDLYSPMINGVATFSRNLARGMVERGHEVVVIAPSATGKKGEEVDGRYRVVRTLSVPFPPISGVRASISPYIEVRRTIKQFQPDIIHVQTPVMIGLSSMQVGERLSIPMIATNHAMSENIIENIRLLSPVAKPTSWFLKEYFRLIHRNVSKMTFPSQTAVDIFGSEKLSMPVEVVSNGIDLSRFRPLSVPATIYKRYGISQRAKIVLYVGRIDSEKHIATLVRAFALVRREIADAHLVLVGQGNDTDNLREIARELGITQHTTFTGRVSDDDLPVLQRLGTVYCMTSPAELQCIAMLEAMASGQPVVSVDAGPLYELCQDGRNGYLCRVDDPVDMAEKVMRILKNPSRRAAMAQESLAIAQTHNLIYTLDRFEAIYREVITQPPRTRRRTIDRLLPIKSE